MDDDESVLNGLVSKAADLHNSSKNGFTNILNTWVWDGEYGIILVKIFFLIYLICGQNQAHL